ncbi:MAG: hypothetical protein P8168_11935 [Deltaproteobacteria bacterium]
MAGALPPKGLFNKVKNRRTRRKFVVSTIRKEGGVFETAVFEANFFYLPRSWNHPDLAIRSSTRDEAWELHYRLTARFTTEHPLELLREYYQMPSSQEK